MKTLQTTRPLRVLVCDDSDDNLALMRQFLATLGHTMIPAHSGEEAVTLFSQERPDLVLMDVMLPGIDGNQAASRIRELAGDTWVPMIFMSALNQPADMVRALDAGGDDFVSKPFDLRLLAAKVRAMARIADIQARLAETTRQLQEYRDRAEAEMEMARTIIEHIQPENRTLPPGFCAFNQPTDRLSGDISLARCAPNGDIYLIHADSMGHGLPAALPLLPIVPIFNRMVEEERVVSAIVREMNQRLRDQMPIGRFIAATVARIDVRNRVIEIWNGGCPPALVIAADGSVAARFAANHLSLGIVDDAHFDNHVTVQQFATPVRLLIYSDGLDEVLGADAKPLGVEAVVLAVGPPTPSDTTKAALDRLRQVLDHHLDGVRAHDDISFALLDF